jgi:ent-kaurene synthase
MLWKWNFRWDVDVNTVFCSEAVKIIFSAIRSTICEIGEKSVERQGRNVKGNVIKIVRCFFIFLLTFFY